MERVGDRKKWKDLVRQAKAPLWAVVSMEEEEDIIYNICILLVWGSVGSRAL
jgi:hypothetical protein